MDLPQISLHSFPPVTIQLPLPALGYLKGYVEKHNTDLKVRTFYWSQKIITDVFHGSELFSQPLSIEQVHIFRAIYSALFFLTEKDNSRYREGLNFSESWGSLFIKSKSRLQFKNMIKKVEEYTNAVIKENKFDTDDIVGASTLFKQEIASITFLHKIKNSNPNVLTVLGGMSQDDAKVILNAFPSIDIGVIGEGERSFLKICEQYPSYDSLHEIGGIAYRKNGEIVINEEDPPIQEIDDIWANYEGFDWNISSTRGAIVLPIWDSRGCWWNQCKFCDCNRISQCTRERSPDSIVNEIKYHYQMFKEIQDKSVMVTLLGPDSRGGSNKRFISLMKKLINLKQQYKGLSLFVELSPLYMTEEMMILLNDLEGFGQWGFEQWNRMVKVMNKPHQVEHGIYTLKLIEKYPMITLNGLNVLIGFPGETIEDVHESITTLKKMKFILSILKQEKRTQNPNPIPIVVRSTSPLGQKWDFKDPIVKENQLNNPFCRAFTFMCGDKNLALEYMNNTEGFILFDVTNTAGLTTMIYKDLLQYINSANIKSYISSENIFNLILSDMFDKKLLELDEYDVKILKQTNKIISLAILEKNLPELRREQIKEILNILEDQELMYSRNDRYINMLPSKIQKQLDSFTT